MGVVSNLFGGSSGNSGGAGMNFSATGADPAQLRQANVNAEGGLELQRSFIDALRQNQNQALGSQGLLFNLLQGQAQGQGPNPALAQYQHNANQIGAQTAGLIGAQKGISPALAARLVAQQGGEAKQNAAGQAAVLQAQQQLAAQNALANLSSNQIAQQQGAMNAYTQGALGQQGNLLGIQGSANSANAGVASQTARQQGALLGGVLGGVGSALGLAHGGEVPQKFAFGGDASAPQSNFAKSLQGMGGEGMQGLGDGNAMNAGMSALIGGVGKLLAPAAPAQVDQNSPLGAFAPGNSAPLMGDQYAQNVMNMHGAPSYAAPNYAGALMNQQAGMACGGPVINGETYAYQMKPVPGSAQVAGDSKANDTVPAKLSPGEVIIPRSVMQSDDPVGHAARFVAAVMAKNGRGLPK